MQLRAERGLRTVYYGFCYEPQEKPPEPQDGDDCDGSEPKDELSDPPIELQQDISFSGLGSLHIGQTRALFPSSIFCNSSNTWLHFPHRYSYIGIYFPSFTGKRSDLRFM